MKRNNVQTLWVKYFLSLVLFSVVASSQASGISVSWMTVEGRIAPLGLDELCPRFGWVIESEKKDVVQTGYHLQVATDRAFSSVVWDSGEVQSDSSQWVEWKGGNLLPDTDYFWRVRVRTNKGISRWSEISKWSTGLFNDTNWQGEWIGTDTLTAYDSDQRHSRASGRYFRKELHTRGLVKRAVVHVSGLGYYALWMNGQRVGNDWLTPAPTDYRKTVAYNTYDVTDLIRLYGNNVSVAALVEAGYYFAPAQNYQTNVRTTYGTPRLRLHLTLEYADGTRETIATDGSWKMNCDGAMRYSNIYDGEFYDSRKEFEGWTKPGFDDSAWSQAQVVSAPGGRMRGNITEPARVYETDKPLEIRKIENRYIVDFGTNGAGVIRLKIHAQSGDTVRIRHAETLSDDGKSLYTANMRSAETTAWYVSNGKETVWNPEFTWFGFRYAEVTGVSCLDEGDVERLLISDNLSADGNVISTSDSVLNAVLKAAYRGIRSNYKGFPIDCPQRDERMPWLGDRTMGCFGESYLMNVHSIYSKWTQDIHECQQASGAISDVAPAYWRLYNHNVTWPAALPFACKMLFEQYGDIRPLERHREAVCKWLDYVKKKSFNEGLITYDRYGDWCVPPEGLDIVLTQDSTRMTDGALLSSSYFYTVSKMMGRDVEAEEMRRAINDKFLKDGSYANGTVTANLLPLAMGIVPQEHVPEVNATLISTIARNEYKQTCGVIGLQWLMRYLSAVGRGDIAWKMATSDNYPSWGYMIKNGATTIWELWNGNTANPSMNSGNHVMMLGDLIPWVCECLAGIRPSLPGFKQIELRPDFNIRELDDIKVSHRSPYGIIRSEWRRINGTVCWDVEIPANTAATVFLPDGTVKRIGSGKYRYELNGNQ